MKKGKIILNERSRRGKYNEWVMTGTMPNSNVPIWEYDWDAKHVSEKYPPAKLREIRKKNGVGSVKRKKQNEL